jgi:hypothetical protein
MVPFAIALFVEALDFLSRVTVTFFSSGPQVV